MARPSILTDALIADFCSKLRISGSIETAIKAAGIGRESYYGWARKVRDGRGSVMERKLIKAVDRAEGEIKLVREHMLSKHFEKNWQCLAWWLERKHSNEYGQRRPLPLPDPDAAGVEHKVIERIVWDPNPKQPDAKPTDAKPTESATKPTEPPDIGG